MKNDLATMAGIEVAKKDGEITECPYDADSDLADAWKRGYRLVKPDGKTSIERVFTLAFGGPARLDFDSKEIPPWAKKENFTLDEDEPESYGKFRKKAGAHTEWNKVFQKHLISDGTYDVTDIPFFYIEDAETLDDIITNDGLEFVKKYGTENIYIANGYQVNGIFLFAGEPRAYIKTIGSFGRGACALFTDCPKSILIVAQDD